MGFIAISPIFLPLNIHVGDVICLSYHGSEEQNRFRHGHRQNINTSAVFPHAMLCNTRYSQRN